MQVGSIMTRCKFPLYDTNIIGRGTYFLKQEKNLLLRKSICVHNACYVVGSMSVS